jgi:hypothetical protein
MLTLSLFLVDGLYHPEHALKLSVLVSLNNGETSTAPLIVIVQILDTDGIRIGHSLIQGLEVYEIEKLIL